MYLTSGLYAPESGRGAQFDDPAFGILARRDAHTASGNQSQHEINTTATCIVATIGWLQIYPPTAARASELSCHGVSPRSIISSSTCLSLRVSIARQNPSYL